MARVGWRRLLARMLSLTGCIHPFRLSRLAALVELEYMARTGERLTDARYVSGPGVFFIEGFDSFVDGECVLKREGDPSRGVRGCIYYSSECTVPELPGDVEELVRHVIDEYSDLSDEDLNSRVVGHPLYKKLTGA